MKTELGNAPLTFIEGACLMLNALWSPFLFSFNELLPVWRGHVPRRRCFSAYLAQGGYNEREEERAVSQSARCSEAEQVIITHIDPHYNSALAPKPSWHEKSRNTFPKPDLAPSALSRDKRKDSSTPESSRVLRAVLERAYL